MKLLSTFLISVGFACFLGGILAGCDAWELPTRKTRRTCLKPAGRLDAQLLQRRVDFAIADSAGTIDQVTWEFGNGSTSVTAGLTVSYTYPATGHFSVRAILSNTCGLDTILSRTVDVADPVIPTVSLQSATGIANTLATLSMTIASAGNATVTRYGICYSRTNSDPKLDKGDVLTMEKTAPAVIDTPVSFTLTDLEPNTLYYVRSFAVNMAGTGYSEPIQSFRTGSAPSVTNLAPSNVGITNASANFIVTNPGSPAATEYGICYSPVTISPEISNSYRANSTNPVVGVPTTVLLTGLLPATRYYYRSFARLPNGEVVYGDPAEVFTTQVNTLTQDLVASLSFTDGSLLDASGNSNNASLVDNPSFVTDRKERPNAAILLDGQNDYFYIEENSTLRPASLSISLWIKPSTLNRSMQLYNKSSRIFDGVNEMYSSQIQPNTGGSSIVVSTDIKQNSNCQAEAGRQNFSFTRSILPNTWHHVVLIYSGRSIRIYFDNALARSEDTLPNSLIDDCVGGDLKFGKQSQSNPNYFYGALDDIRIYRRALSASEVQALYNQ